MKESDFLSMIENIDKELRRRDVPIVARPIHAIGEASKHLEIKIIGGPNLLPAVLIRALACLGRVGKSRGVWPE